MFVGSPLRASSVVEILLSLCAIVADDLEETLQFSYEMEVIENGKNCCKKKFCGKNSGEK